MSQRRFDWEPETRSLYRRLKRSGFVPTLVSNGCDPEAPKSEAHALSVLTASDTAQLTVTKDGETFRVFLVYGNSPGELASDYTWRETPAGRLLDETINAHGDAWEGRRQPTKVC